MKKLGLFFCLSLVSAFATANDAPVGDAEAGKAKTLVCAACHGTDGNSSIPMNPKLAGQHANYIAKQLQEFKLAMQTGGKEGRNNAIMGMQANVLSEQDMLDIAAYYQSQESKIGAAPEDVIPSGEALYRGGDAERKITACIACHGPRGNGMGLAGFPDISGQHAEYTAAQLKMFRSGDRNNDMNAMMRDIAKKLTDEDIEILSQYLAGLY